MGLGQRVGVGGHESQCRRWLCEPVSLAARLVLTRGSSSRWGWQQTMSASAYLHVGEEKTDVVNDADGENGNAKQANLISSLLRGRCR